MSGSKLNKSSLWNALGIFMFSASGILMMMFVSIKLGVEKAGIFGISYATSQIIYTVSRFGVNELQITDYSSKYDFSSYFYSRIITCAASLLFSVLLCFALHFTPEKTACTLLLTLFVVINTFADMYQNLFFVNGRLDLTGKAAFFRNLIATAVFFAALAVSKNMLVSLALSIIANLISSYIFIAPYIKPFLPDNLSYNAQKISAFMKNAVLLFLCLMAMTVTQNIPKYAIHLLLDDAVQGYFDILFTPVPFINLICLALIQPKLKDYSKYITEGDTVSLKTLLIKHLFIITALTFAACAFAYFIGAYLVGIFFGVSIIEYKGLLALMMLGGGFWAINMLFYYLMIITDKTRVILYNNLVCGAVCVILSYMTVAKMQLSGAAIAFTASQAAITLIYIINTTMLFGKKR